MKGMRNVVAHKYGAVDHTIIWNALESDLPREVAHIKRILDLNRPGVSGDSKPWEGWSHARRYAQAVSA